MNKWDSHVCVCVHDSEGAMDHCRQLYGVTTDVFTALIHVYFLSSYYSMHLDKMVIYTLLIFSEINKLLCKSTFFHKTRRNSSLIEETQSLIMFNSAFKDKTAWMVLHINGKFHRNTRTGSNKKSKNWKVPKTQHFCSMYTETLHFHHYQYQIFRKKLPLPICFLLPKFVQIPHHSSTVLWRSCNNQNITGWTHWIML